MVEHRTLNPKVAGSSPAASAISSLEQREPAAIWGGWWLWEPPLGKVKESALAENYFVPRGVLRSHLGRQCPYCNQAMTATERRRPTRDHVRPRRAGGTLQKRNVLIVCSACNGDKGDTTLRSWWESLKAIADPRAPNVKRLLERGADQYETFA